MATGDVVALRADHSGTNAADLDDVAEHGLVGGEAGVEVGEMDISGGGEPFKMES